jgi:predicted negative regulator of RcsB-dependent stress response
VADYLNDDEQVAALRKWWEENGTFLVVALLVVGGSVFGWRWFQDYTRTQQEAASMLYEEYLENRSGLNTGANVESRQVELLQQLDSKYPDSSYATFALFYRATDALQEKDVEKAEALLRQALSRAPTDEMRDLSRTRLARLLQQAGTYLCPNDEQADNSLTRLFNASASSQIGDNQELDINERPILARRCAKGIVWFEFDNICDGPRSQADYIEVARWYPEVIVSGVPVFDATSDNQARRFIALVDEFYDRRVKLIISADDNAKRLYRGRKLAFEFERTSSRLIEMQSDDYLSQAHLCD